MADDGHRVRRVAAIVARRDEPPGLRRHAEEIERVAGQVLRAHPLLVLRAGEDDRPDDLRAHGEEVDMGGAGVAERHEQGIAEGVGLGPLGGVGREREVDQLPRRADGQRPEDERVEQREGGGAGPERERQRDDGGRRDAGVPAQHARPHAHVAHHRVEPRQQLDVTALLPGAQRAAEAPPGFGRGFFWRHARRRQLFDPPLEMELELLVEEIVVDPFQRKTLATRDQSDMGLTSLRVLQNLADGCGDGLPALFFGLELSSTTRRDLVDPRPPAGLGRRPARLIQPVSSSRWSAG